MTVQSPPGVPPPPPPQPAAPKKGLGPLAWIGIGCGVIIVIGLIAMSAGVYLFKTKVVDPLQKNPGLTAAKLVVQANPDLDLVSEDDNAGTLTVHNKKTNETVTVNMNDIKDGKFKFTSDKGSATLDVGKQGITVKAQDEKGQESTFVAGTGAPKDLPAWLPVYPGGTIQAGFSTQSAQQSAQSFTIKTTDSADKVLAFYSDRLKAAGLTVQPTATLGVGGQTSTGTVIADAPDKSRQVRVVASSTADQTQVSVSYEEKKQ
jgi:hypothetical protein